MNLTAELLRALPLARLTPWRVAVFAAIAALAFAGGKVFRPGTEGAAPPIELRESIPQGFGNWQEIKSVLVPIDVTPVDRAEAVQLTYDDSLLTTYADQRGRRVMVALAYGRSQRQEGKIHRPELCYASQGFKVEHVQRPASSNAAALSNRIVINRLVAKSGTRKELVSYWIRIGDLFSGSAVQTRLYLLSEGLGGRIPDGILFRASQIVSGFSAEEAIEDAFAAQEAMMFEMVRALPPERRRLLIGDALARTEMPLQ